MDRFIDTGNDELSNIIEAYNDMDDVIEDAKNKKREMAKTYCKDVIDEMLREHILSIDGIEGYGISVVSMMDSGLDFIIRMQFIVDEDVINDFQTSDVCNIIEHMRPIKMFNDNANTWIRITKSYSDNTDYLVDTERDDEEE